MRMPRAVTYKILYGLMAVLVLLSAVLSVVAPGSVAHAQSPITGYDACKSVVIAHTDDGAQTNYQMKLTINKSSGTSNGSLLYLDNKSTNWPYDIRFTNATGVNLDFWREEYDATDGTWWVEVDSIAAHPADTTIYVHVGDADAADASNGGNTFLFFDDFSGVSLDTSLWQGDTANCAVASSICTLTAATNAYYKLATKDGWANDVRMRARGIINNSNYCAIVFNQEDNLTNQNDCLKAQHNSVNTNHSNWNTQKSGTPTYISHDLIDFGNYHVYDFIRLLSGTDTSKVFCDNVQVGSDTTTNVPIVSLSPLIGTGETTGQTVALDWVAVMISTYTEPTWGTWGSWQYPTVYLTTSSTSGGNVTTPGEGTYAYNVSEIVNISATADIHYHFVNWTGSTANITNVNLANTTINMSTSNQTAAANFAIDTYTLTYTAGAHGSISGSSPQIVNYGANGASVTAIADVGYYFVSWSDSSTQNPRTDTNIVANITVTASFAIINLNAPTGLSITEWSTSITLSWTQGANTTGTTVVMSDGQYYNCSSLNLSALPYDTHLIYSGPNTSIDIGGLDTFSHEYFFTLWGTSGGVYSNDCAQISYKGGITMAIILLILSLALTIIALWQKSRSWKMISAIPWAILAIYSWSQYEATATDSWNYLFWLGTAMVVIMVVASFGSDGQGDAVDDDSELPSHLQYRKKLDRM